MAERCAPREVRAANVGDAHTSGQAGPLAATGDERRPILSSSRARSDVSAAESLSAGRHARRTVDFVVREGGSSPQIIQKPVYRRGPRGWPSAGRPRSGIVFRASPHQRVIVNMHVEHRRQLGLLVAHTQRVQRDPATGDARHSPPANSAPSCNHRQTRSKRAVDERVGDPTAP